VRFCDSREEILSLIVTLFTKECKHRFAKNSPHGYFFDHRSQFLPRLEGDTDAFFPHPAPVLSFAAMLRNFFHIWYFAAACGWRGPCAQKAHFGNKTPIFSTLK